MTVTETLALVGALTGTSAILWDIYKWINSGARLRVHVSPNTILIGDGFDNPNQNKRISVEVVNIGLRKTTIVTLGFRCDENLFSSLTKRGRQYFVVPQPEFAQLPKGLDVGERWVGLVSQSPEIEEMAKTKRLYVQVSHSFAAKPVYKRLTIKQ